MASHRRWNRTIRDDVNHRMCTRFVDNVDKSFITSEDLQRVWGESVDSFRDMQTATGMNFGGSGVPFSDCMKVISILIMIDFKPWRLVSGIIANGLRDVDLPFHFEDLSSHWFKFVENNVHLARSFVNQQYAFCPIVIEKGRDLRQLDRHLRLPLVSEELVGEGTYGAVFKVKIAKGYFREQNGNTYSHNTGVC